MGFSGSSCDNKSKECSQLCFFDTELVLSIKLKFTSVEKEEYF